MIDFPDLWADLKENWHKYGIFFLLLNHAIEKMRNFKENANWIWNKLTWLPKKIYGWLHPKK